MPDDLRGGGMKLRLSLLAKSGRDVTYLKYTNSSDSQMLSSTSIPGTVVVHESGFGEIAFETESVDCMDIVDLRFPTEPK